MPAQVMIWPNAKSVKAAGHPGHAALRIDMCDANGQRVTDQDCYISWWPGSYQDDDKHKSGPFSQRPVRTHSLEDDLQSEMSDRTRQQLTSGNIQPRQGQLQTTVGQGANQRLEWVQLPTHVIFLPGAGEVGFNQARLGLNLQRIRGTSLPAIGPRQSSTWAGRLWPSSNIAKTSLVWSMAWLISCPKIDGQSLLVRVIFRCT